MKSAPKSDKCILQVVPPREWNVELALPARRAQRARHSVALKCHELRRDIRLESARALEARNAECGNRQRCGEVATEVSVHCNNGSPRGVLVKEARLCGAIRGHRVMKIEMVLRQVRERCDVKAKAACSGECECNGRDLHAHVRGSGVAHRRKQSRRLIALRRRMRRGPREGTEEIANGSDESTGGSAFEVVDHVTHEVRHSRLSVRARDANELKAKRRVPMHSGRRATERITNALHDDERNGNCRGVDHAFLGEDG